jgi:hypothetical protein
MEGMVIFTYCGGLLPCYRGEIEHRVRWSEDHGSRSVSSFDGRGLFRPPTVVVLLVRQSHNLEVLNASAWYQRFPLRGAWRYTAFFSFKLSRGGVMPVCDSKQVPLRKCSQQTAWHGAHWQLFGPLRTARCVTRQVCMGVIGSKYACFTRSPGGESID